MYYGYSATTEKDSSPTEDAVALGPSGWVQNLLDKLKIVPIRKNIIHASIKDGVPKVMEKNIS